MKPEELDYPLPEELIAQEPLKERDACRLCVVHRDGSPLLHRHFFDLGLFLRPGDLLVMNNSKVLPLRIPCRKEGSGGAVEVFLLDGSTLQGAKELKAFLKPARRAKPGQRLYPELKPEAGFFRVLQESREEGALVQWEGALGLGEALLNSFGVTPLPPYIHRERIPEAQRAGEDAEYYQTSYAKVLGSSAAPTAGLHFSPPLLKSLESQGVEIAELTLHVGPGTFLPVKSPTLEEHRMHRERYSLDETFIRQLRKAKQEGRRVIAVGTTSTRVLEAAFDNNFEAKSGWADTDIFIKPGYSFKVVDALITNFHQPKSTLIALVAAFYDLNKILEAYAACMEQKYRFLSFGDAMFII